MLLRIAATSRQNRGKPAARTLNVPLTTILIGARKLRPPKGKIRAAGLNPQLHLRRAASGGPGVSEKGDLVKKAQRGGFRSPGLAAESVTFSPLSIG